MRGPQVSKIEYMAFPTLVVLEKYGLAVCKRSHAFPLYDPTLLDSDHIHFSSITKNTISIQAKSNSSRFPAREKGQWPGILGA